MKIRLDAYEKQHRQGRRILAVLVVVGLAGLSWLIIDEIMSGRKIEAEQFREFAIFFIVASGVYAGSIISRSIIRSLANKGEAQDRNDPRSDLIRGESKRVSRK